MDGGAPVADNTTDELPPPPTHCSPIPATAVGRMAMIFLRTLHYCNLGSNSEARNQGSIPLAELKGFLSDWSREVTSLLRLEVQRFGAIAPLQTPTLFVGNHLSYLDIPVLMSQVPVVLLGKQAIARWPVLGAAGRRAGMVFVNRSSDSSRKLAFEAITNCLETRGMSIGLFPSGTTSLNEGRSWRSGAFRIAKEGGFPVQPFRLTYDPVLPAAFLGQDYFLPHLFRLLNANPIQARIEFGEPRMVVDPDSTAAELRSWSRAAAAN